MLRPFLALHLAVLALSAGCATGEEWRLPVPHGQEGCGDREAAGSCITVQGGDSAGFLDALGDSRIDEVWLAGAVSVPPQTELVHVERDLLIGGLSLDTLLHFEEGGSQPFLILHGFTALVRLRLSGFLAPRSLDPAADSDKQQIFGIAKFLTTKLGERLPEMPPFQQQWIPGPPEDNHDCTVGLAFYQCNILIPATGIFQILSLSADNETVAFLDLFLKVLDLNLGNAALNDLTSSSKRTGVVDFSRQTAIMTQYSLVYSELVAYKGFPCGYLSNTSINLDGRETDPANLPSAKTLHDGLTDLEAECQTRSFNSPGGRNYGGNMTVSYTGKTCVPWKDVNMLNLDFSFIEGNSCRNPTDTSGVYCFVELDPIFRRTDNASIRQPPMYVREHCDVPECGFTSTNSCQWAQDGGRSYVGNTSISQSGNKCLPWTDITGMYETYGPGGRSCRNPSGSESSLWCFTENSEQGSPKQGHTKELCAIPLCDGMPVAMERTTVRIEEVYPEWFADRDTPAYTSPHLGLPAPSGSDTALGASFSIGIIATLTIIVVFLFAGALAWIARKRIGHAAVIKMLEECHWEDKLDVEANGPSKSKMVPSSRGSFTSKVQLNSRLEVVPTELGLVTLERQIGVGATSKVYKGQWMDSDVAVKIIRLGAMPEQMRQTLVESVEATSICSISHPNVVQTFALYEVVKALPPDDNSIEELWIIQEWCDAGDYTLFPPALGMGQEAFAGILAVLIQIVKGVKYLHSIGIAHGDLKRANVLRKSIMGQGEVCKVTDLGMAHIIDEHDYYISNNVVGDFACMAPEAIFDKRVSKKMDVYSFGIIMFELYTGETAFPRGNFAAHCRRLSEMQRPEFPTSTPVAFRTLAEQCWDNDPQGRPSVDSILRALQEMQGVALGNDEEASRQHIQMPSASTLLLEQATPGYVIPDILK